MPWAQGTFVPFLVRTVETESEMWCNQIIDKNCYFLLRPTTALLIGVIGLAYLSHSNWNANPRGMIANLLFKPEIQKDWFTLGLHAVAPLSVNESSRPPNFASQMSECSFLLCEDSTINHSRLWHSLFSLVIFHRRLVTNSGLNNEFVTRLALP